MTGACSTHEWPPGIGLIALPPVNPTAQAAGVCPKCGSTESQVVKIHGGQSLRRDCRSCGRFIDWPRWTPAAERRGASA